MDNRTIRDLQFNRIVQSIADCCRTARGRDLVSRLGPFSRIDDARAELALVEEAADLIRNDLLNALEPVDAMDIAIATARKGGILSNDELIAFARLLTVAGEVRRQVLESRLRAPKLAVIFENCKSMEAVRERIEQTFAEDGSIRDDASPRLSELRSKVRTISRRVKTDIEEMLKDSQVRTVLQDDYFTLREGRYVLPVKAEDYRFVPGIIHGTSQTGHTFFVEPSRIVEDNNQLKVAIDEIVNEEEAIRADRTSLISRFSLEIIELCDGLWRVDSIAGRAGFLVRHGGGGSAAPEIVENGQYLILKGAINPVLAIHGSRKVVPIDLDSRYDGSGDDSGARVGLPGFAVVVSGPNAGGKSVTLSTIGLSCMMVRHGIVPLVGEGTKIPWYDRVLTVIGDPTDMDRAVSNFTGQLVRLQEILNSGTGRTLVLVDELATGTEPRKGEALAAAIVEHLVERGAECFVATHYDQLKRAAAEDRRFGNIRVGVDRSSGLPNFRIEHGESGESNPFEVARSIGFPEAIIRRALDLTGLRERQLEEALAQARALNVELLAERAATAELKAKAAEDRKKYGDELVRLRKESDRLVYQARQDVLRKMKTLEDELEKIAAEAREEKKKAEAARREDMIIRRRDEVRVKKEEVRRDMDNEAELAGQIPGERIQPSEVTVGMKVFVIKLKAEGVVTEVGQGGRKFTVQVGLLKTAVKPDEIRKPEQKKAAPKQMTGRERDRMIKEQSSTSRNPLVELQGADPVRMFVRSPENTIDIRGMRVDEATDAVDKHLDTAFMNEEPTVMIIHGMGTSALRKAVRDRLKKVRFVKSMRSGEQSEGGEGVTIIELG